MGSFEIYWKNSAEKELRRIDKKHILRIIHYVGALSKAPFPVTCRKLEGAESIYRIPVGDYRIIYEVNTKNSSVVIYHVRHRKDAYRRT